MDLINTHAAPVVVAVFFAATLVRSTFGFGEALIAVPLLAFAVPVEVAAPVAVLVSITVAALVVARDWQHVQLRSAGRLLISTLFGLPIGLVLLRTVPESIVKLMLGALVAGFSTWSLARAHAHKLEDDRLAWVFGGLAGVLGGAYGMNGPPLAVYGTMRRWPPAQFRATLQGYFLPASVLGLIGYWATGLWTPTAAGFTALDFSPTCMRSSSPSGRRSSCNHSSGSSSEVVRAFRPARFSYCKAWAYAQARGRACRLPTASTFPPPSSPPAASAT